MRELKEKFRRGEKTFGTWITIGHPVVVELLCQAGFDWFVIDLEHTTISLETAHNLCNVAQNQGIPVMIRVAKNDEVLIKRCLDMGANGVVVPNIKNAQDAQDAINHTFYPPLGKRGVGLFRAQGYGESFDSYRDNLQQECILIGQIEHIEASENIHSILDYDAFDGFIIGPYDLSGSMGYPGQFDREDVREAISKIHDAFKERGKTLGMHSVPPDPQRLLKELDQGFGFAAYSTDFYFLRHTAKTHLEQIRKESK